MTCAPIILFVAAVSFLIGGMVGAYVLHMLSRTDARTVGPSDEPIYGDVPNVEGR